MKAIRQKTVLLIVYWACMQGVCAAVVTDWPIPEYRDRPGIWQRQYARYHAEPLMKEAFHLIENRAYDAAEQNLNKALRIDPANNHIKLMIIRISDRTGNFQRGVHLCDELLKNYPAVLDLYFDKAHLATKIGQDEEAIAAVETVLQRAPESYARRVEGWKVLAEAYTRLNQYEKAWDYADRWWKSEQDPRAMVVLAECLARQGKPEDALKLLDGMQGKGRTPEQEGVVQLKRGYLLSSLKQFKAADEALQKSAVLMPAPEIQLAISRQLAMNASQDGRHEAAAKYFKTCVDAKFDETMALACIESMTSAKQWKEVSVQIRAWLASATWSPKGRASALKSLMFASKNQGDDVSYFAAASEVARAGGVAELREAGMAAERLKKHDEASLFLKKALTLEFDEATVLNYLGALNGAGKWQTMAEVASDALKRKLSDGGRQSALRHLMYGEKNRGNNEGYRSAARELLKTDALPSDLREAALAAGRLGEVEESIRLYRESLDKEFSESAMMAYLDALAAANQWKTAAAVAAPLLERTALSPLARKTVVRTVMYSSKNLGDKDAYLGAARLLVKLEASPDVYSEAALAAWQNNKLEEAAEFYRAGLEKKADPDMALNYAFVLKLLGKTAEQQQVLKGIIEGQGEGGEIRRTARYELAQIYLKDRKVVDYLATMQVVVKENPEPSRLREYAGQLYLSGESATAQEMFARSLKAETVDKRKFDLCVAMADLLVALGKYPDARHWYTEACQYGAPDQDWNRRMGRVEYEVGSFQSAADLLAGMQPPDDLSKLYAGFAFYKLGLPGLALYHLNQVKDAGRLTSSEQYTFYANRAYLNFDQDQFESALVDADRALAIHRTPDLEVARFRILLGLSAYDTVVREGEKLAESVTNRVPLRADLLDLIGRAHLENGDAEAAILAFSQAIEIAPDRADLRYLRGMAYRRAGHPKEAAEELQAYADRIPAPAATFWGDAGVTAGLNKDYPQGISALSKAVGFYPYEIDSIEEKGYQQMKSGDRVAARESFRRAIDIYDEVIPQLDNESKAYLEDRLAMKKEQSKLDKSVGLQAYLSKTDYNLSSNEALISIDGALPSQYGAELNWRPPWIGFRDEHIFEVFGRWMGNFEPNSWNMNTESWQGGAGARYKPFAALNFNTSFERLFKIGDEAEDNWLWRNMMSIERGTSPVPESSWWMAESVYGELSYYLDDPERWIYYLDAKVGPSFPLGPRGALTVPQFIGATRYQSDDPTGIGTYSLLGIGIKARMLEGEKQYSVERWYMDAFLHYTWGWFRDTPDGFDKRSFDGVVFGVNFVK